MDRAQIGHGWDPRLGRYLNSAILMNECLAIVCALADVRYLVFQHYSVPTIGLVFVGCSPTSCLA